jgi:RNA polymerase sigma factor (sigma-70 family)
LDRERLNASATGWTDERLVEQCVKGNDEAWAALVHKYKNLIFSIPVKLGFSREDAGEIFQQVCLTLVRELSHLRDPKSLAGWLIKTTSHACYEWSRRERRYATVGDADDAWSLTLSDSAEDLLREVEKEQLLRNAIQEARPRCREMIQMLFFETPPIPYEEVARRLGIATGSIGFVRMRCLQNLRTLLQKKGF